MHLAVAGGTGVVGALVVQAARASGDTVVVLTRSTGVDLMTGDGLDEALAGVSTVVDVSGTSSTARSRAVRFFETATTQLLTAGQRAGVSHHVALSIVGCDRVPFGYYQGKCRQEELVTAGPLPWTVLRTTQFHEFAGQVLDRAKGPALVPTMLCQPVAAQDVAVRLLEIARSGPAGRTPELAGPEQLRLQEMARRLLRARGQRRLVVPVRLPGGVGTGMAGGGLLPTGGAELAGPRFEEWLTDERSLR